MKRGSGVYFQAERILDLPRWQPETPAPSAAASFALVVLTDLQDAAEHPANANHKHFGRCKPTNEANTGAAQARLGLAEL